MPTQVQLNLVYDTGFPNKHLVLDWPTFEKMYDFLAKAPALVFDFETSGLDWFKSARACGIALASWDSKGDLQSYYVPFRHASGEPGKQLPLDKISPFIFQLLGNPNTLKIAHNMKFDEHIAFCDGWFIGGSRYDTMIAARLYDENRSAALKTRAVEDLNKPEAAKFEKVVDAEVYRLAKEDGLPVADYRSKYGYSKVNIPLLGTYACFDAEFTGQLYQFYERFGVSTKYAHIWDIEMRLIGVLGTMERRGMRVDIAYLEALRGALGGVLTSIKDTICHQLGGKEFNMGSDADLREVLTTRLGITLTKRTKGNQLSVDKEVLEQFVDHHPVVRHMIDWKEAEKLYSTYTTSIVERLDKDNTLHPDFQSVGTYTGRLSCRSPNFQNQPVDSDARARKYSGKGLEAGGKDPWSIRRAFVVRSSDYVRLYFDYSQIELRVLAFYSKDPVMVSAYTAGEDIHERTSLEVFGTKEKAKRRLAKVINFGLSYGMQAQGFSAQTGIPYAEAEKYLAIFFERYHGITNFRLRFWDEVRKNRGYFQNIFGRPRHIEGLDNPDNYERAKAERKAIATLIQGTAAELTKESLVRIDDYFRIEKVPAYIVSTVHDEIQIDSPIKIMVPVARRVKELMEFYPMFAPIPILTDVEVSSSSWSDKRKVKL